MPFGIREGRWWLLGGHAVKDFLNQRQPLGDGVSSDSELF